MSSASQHGAASAQARDAQRFACHVARLLSDSRCEDVLVLDLRGLSSVADFFVISTGTSERQIQSLMRDVAELGEQEGHGSAAAFADRGGEAAGGWAVVDFFDVVIHMFSADLRAYYDLESLWADAAHVDWRAVTQPGQFARVTAKD